MLRCEAATAQFQRVMDAILSGIKGVMVRVDDILVATSGSVSANLEILKRVILFSKLAHLCPEMHTITKFAK